MIKKVIIFSAVSISALILGFFLPDHWLPQVYNYSAYYFIFAAVGLWVALILDILRNDFLTNVRLHAPALLSAVLLVSLIFHISPPQFKTLADETNLVSVSMAMHQNKTVSILLQGMAVEYYPFEFDQTVGSRPLLFPFLISIVHAVVGYSPFNGMVVNFFCGIGILFLMYLLTVQLFSRFFGFIAMIIMASFPIFIFWVTSSGFETVNLFFILIVLLTLFLFLKHRDVKYAELSLYSLVLLANCRYESIIFFFSLITIAPHFINQNIIAKYRFSVFCLPFFFLPLAWQRQIIFFFPFLYGSSGMETHEQLFSIDYFIQHISSNIFAFTGINTDFGFLFLIFLASAAGIYLLFKKMLLGFRSIDPTIRQYGIYVAVSGLLLFMVYTSFVWGQFTMSIANRMATSLTPFIILPAVYFFYRVFNEKFPHAKKILVFFLLVQIIIYWPVAAEQRMLKKNAPHYLYERVVQFLYKNYDLKKDKLLLISDRPNFFVIHNIGSIGFQKAIQEQQKIFYLENVYYDQILVLQKCNPISNDVFTDNQLSDKISLHEIARIHVSDNYYLRISKASYGPFSRR